MKPRGFFGWIGICIISLVLGLLLGCFSSALLGMLIPFGPSEEDFSNAYDQYLERLHHLQIYIFIWSTICCVVTLGFTAQIRFHILFFNGLAILVSCIFVTKDTWDLTRTLDGPNYRDLDVLTRISLIILLINFSLILITASLVADRSANAEIRASRRKMRNSISDGHRPPLQ